MQPFHLLLQFSVFAGFFIPLGEVVAPWILMKLIRPKDSVRIMAGKRLVAFQGSWIIYRFIVILLVGAMWMSAFADRRQEEPAASPPAQTEESAAEAENGFSIPGEPTPTPREDEYAGMDPRKDAREFREWLNDVKGHPELLFIQSMFNQPMVVLSTAVAIAILALMWFFTTMVTALNIIVILRDGRPWYPLTLKWLKKEEAGLNPASVNSEIQS